MQVGVKNLKVVGIEGWSMMREGEAEKQVYIYLIISLFIFNYFFAKKVLHFVQL